MRGFLLGLVVCGLLTGVVALGAGYALQRATPPPTPTPIPKPKVAASPSAPFSQVDAVDVVGERFGTTAKAEQLRKELRETAQVRYHSPQHWTVQWGQATWTAHGPGRYAEPDNDAAREHERAASAGP